MRCEWCDIGIDSDQPMAVVWEDSTIRVCSAKCKLEQEDDIREYIEWMNIGQHYKTN